LKFLLKVHIQKRVKTKHVLLIIFHPIGWLEIDFLIMFYTLVTWAKSMISNNRHINMHYMNNIETWMLGLTFPLMYEWFWTPIIIMLPCLAKSNPRLLSSFCGKLHTQISSMVLHKAST
jgi:hypothetical protein